MSLFRRWVWGVCLAWAWGLGGATPARAAEAPLHVRVQLKWFHQYQFAGFYAALDQGYFREAGLDVELLEGGPTIDPSDTVSQGQAEFGVGNSSLLIDFQRGLPVVAVAAVFQHSPFVILARPDPTLRSVHDLQGRTLMAEAHSAELTAYLKKAGVDLQRVRQVPHSGTVRSLVASGPDGVDAMTAYVSTEPLEAQQLSVPYRIFNPRDLGIDFYGDTLFTTRAFAQQHPEAVVAMRDALVRGWHHANQHPSEMVDLILQRHAPRMDKAALALEAHAVYGLFQADVVDLGYMSPERWQRIGDVFVDTGLMAPGFSLDGFLFGQTTPLPPWVPRLLLWGGLLLLAVGGTVVYVVSINHRLTSSLQQLAVANGELARLSSTDGLTGLHNRRHFDTALPQELARARRHGHPLALVMVDVDAFKAYNDALGHPAGDACLQQLAGELRRHTQRAGELAARLGGEEFALLACGLHAAQALAWAERIRQGVEALAMPHPGAASGRVTISLGVAVVEPGQAPLSAADLLAAADAALYQAKAAGRNQTHTAGGGAPFTATRPAPAAVESPQPPGCSAPTTTAAPPPGG